MRVTDGVRSGFVDEGIEGNKIILVNPFLLVIGAYGLCSTTEKVFPVIEAGEDFQGVGNTCEDKTTTTNQWGSAVSLVVLDRYYLQYKKISTDAR